MNNKSFWFILSALIVLVFLFGVAFKQTPVVDREETEFEVPASINEIWAP